MTNLSPNNYEKVKSNELKEEDDIFLKIEDFPEDPISEMFCYEEAVDKINNMIAPFENDLNPYDINYKNDYYNFEDSLEDQILKIEKESDEILKPMQNHEEINELVPLKNDFKYEDSEMDEEFKGYEMELDEDKNELNEINEDIPKIGLNDDLPRKEKIFEITKVKKSNKGHPKYPRIDDCKIFWRAKVNKWYITTLNNTIKDSDLPKDNSQSFLQKIHSDSHMPIQFR